MKTKIQLFNILLMLIFMSSTLLLTSCFEEEPEPMDDEDEVTLEADFSFSPETPKIGEEVTLDATASFEGSNSGFEILWEITDMPEESESTLTNSVSVETGFTPDKVGDYTVQLTLTSNDSEVTDSETAVITILPGGFIELSGTIDTDRILENVNDEDASLTDYLVVGDLNVSANLTIEPGVHIQFQEGRLISTID